MSSPSLEARLAIGGNHPPEPTPFESARDEVEALYGEASHWLDGAAVDNPALADGIGKLLNTLRTAGKKADEARKVEAEPFDAGKAEVQARYKPLLDKVARATDACKRALAPWLARLEREKQAAAAEAQRIADEKTRAAREAIRASSPDNLAAREAAETLVVEAKKADTAAAYAANDTAKVKGGNGRAISMRTTYRPVIADPVEAARYYWHVNQPAVTDFLISLAEKDVRAGKRSIPGFTIETTNTVV